MKEDMVKGQEGMKKAQEKLKQSIYQHQEAFKSNSKQKFKNCNE